MKKQVVITWKEIEALVEKGLLKTYESSRKHAPYIKTKELLNLLNQDSREFAISLEVLNSLNPATLWLPRNSKQSKKNNKKLPF